MEKVARLNSAERQELFSETSRKAGMPPAIVEKDFWVCWVLKYLFAESSIRDSIVFKGGTSLSKVFELIERFSEDIDLILDWNLLGYSDEQAWENRSRTKQERLNREMNEKADAYIDSNLIPMLQTDLGARNIEGLTVVKGAEQTVRIAYPQTFSHDYIRPEVLLEIGPLALKVPHGSHTIIPYAAQQFPDYFEHASCPVEAISAERTFWEKAAILHQEAHRPQAKQPPARYSRHYYDLHKMASCDLCERALAQVDLLTTVAEFKTKFYPCAWAEYAQARPGSLRLVPAAHGTAALKSDYAAMREMVFGEYPSFDEVLDSLRKLEERINATP